MLSNGKKVCGRDGYKGPNRKVAFAGAAMADNDSDNQSVNAMMSHLGFGMFCDMPTNTCGNGDTMMLCTGTPCCYSIDAEADYSTDADEECEDQGSEDDAPASPSAGLACENASGDSYG